MWSQEYFQIFRSFYQKQYAATIVKTVEDWIVIVMSTEAINSNKLNKVLKLNNLFIVYYMIDGIPPPIEGTQPPSGISV